MKLITKYILFISIALSFSVKGISQTYHFNLQQCRAMALDSNRQIKGARMMEEKTKYDKNAVIAKFLPKFSGYGMYIYSSTHLEYNFSGGALPIYKNQFGDLVPDYMRDLNGNIVYNNGTPVFNQYAMIPPMDISMSLSNSFTAGVKVEQPIFMGLKIVSAYQMAKIGTQMASLNTKMNQSEVVVQVDEAYWLYVKTCLLNDAADDFRKTVDEMYVIVKNAVEVGMATSNDLLKVQVQINNAKLMQSKAKNGKTLSKMNLCNYVGLPLNSDVEVDQSDFTISEEKPLDQGSIENRYDYQLLNKQIELKNKEIAFTRSEFLPQIGIMANYGYIRGLDFNVYAQGTKLMNQLLLDNDGFQAMASVKIPLFAWGEGYFKVKSAKKEKEISINELKRLEELMELEHAKYRFALTDARLQVELTQISLENAETNLKVSKDQYEVGMETLVNVLEAQTQWSKAKSDYIEAVAEYKLSYTKYLKSIGEL